MKERLFWASFTVVAVLIAFWCGAIHGANVASGKWSEMCLTAASAAIDRDRAARKIAADQPGGPVQKFYVTGLYSTPEFNDCTLPPKVCYGIDRLHALAQCGETVWSKEEWDHLQNQTGWKDSCAAAKKAGLLKKLQ